MPTLNMNGIFKQNVDDVGPIAAHIREYNLQTYKRADGRMRTEPAHTMSQHPLHYMENQYPMCHGEIYLGTNKPPEG